MKYFRISILLVCFALVGSTTVEARQIGGLLKKAKQKAEDKVEQLAEREVNKQLNKIVEGFWKDAGSQFENMLMSAMPKAKTSVDLESGIIHRQGQDDQKILDNADAPRDAEFVGYLSISVIQLPSQLAQLGDRFGNATVQEVLLHADRKMDGDDETSTLTDIGSGRFVYLNHEQLEYWSSSFEEMFAMAGEAMGQMNQSMDAMPTSGDQQKAAESVKVDAKVSVKQGERKTVRGLSTQQYIVVVESIVESEEDGEDKGKLWIVSEIWSAESFGGSESLAAFDQKMGEQILNAMEGSSPNGTFNFSALGDPRMSEGMAKANEELAKLSGVPVETNTYFVMTPEDAGIDLDAVLKGSGEAGATASAGASDDQAGESQTTLFSATSFISNLSTEPFDVARLEIPNDYKEVESPLKQYLDPGPDGN